MKPPHSDARQVPRTARTPFLLSLLAALPLWTARAEPAASASPSPANPQEILDPAASLARNLDIDRAFRSGDFSKVLDLTADIEADDPLLTYRAQAFQRRGELRFFAARIQESIADFDAFLALEPDREPYHWQRGISCYYAGEFEKGKTQFERHQSVNPQDVENAVFHFICSLRAPGGSLEKARENLIEIERDPRVPMRQIRAFYAGIGTAEEVIAAAGSGPVNESEKANQLFYAHLYLGLFHDAAGDPEKAAPHIALAAGKYRQDHYMGKVARVHATLRKIPIESPAD